MQTWKINQEIYHRLNKDYRDDLNKFDITISENIVEDAVRHFNERVDQWIYPAKSYFVAICYAHWISEDFHEDFYQLLDDPDLLYGNDPYFKRYSEDKDTYDQILNCINRYEMNGMVPDVHSYYIEEIHLYTPIPPGNN